ncbi:LysE/ArgO family amino acid transporter [Brassicibacter mesophilus]|jgi:L-lysine exporter family protein LysE/ArgO|uniref:LysE/ArgO family amino acid transporter n=1 Tax=Brassicibacter mesophilus TaxID=745119 RepID=UPI003D1DA138
MFDVLIHGFMLGLAYVAPIGMQNIYVINTAISKKKIRAYQVALIVILFDISLALACFFGMGLLMDRFQLLKSIIFLAGSLAVMYIGIMLIKSNPETNREIDTNKSLLQITATCFTVTWLNPQALIDGSLLLGGFKASLPVETSNLFILGVCLASFSWFVGLTTIVSIFKSSFNSKVIKWINIICGSIIIYYGLKLGYSFIKSIF